MMTPRTTAAIAVLLGLFSCAQPQGSPETTVTIGTFNMEWLGDGVGDRKPRTDQDYLRIADIVIKSSADVLAVQEVENQQALDKVLRYLDGYRGIVSAGGNQQRVGVIYRSDVDVQVVSEYTALQLDQPQRLRPGLVVQCRKGAFDWVELIVHLKSTSRYDSTAALLDASRTIRERQAAVISSWVDSVLAAGTELDVVIAGDLNDYPGRVRNATLGPLTSSSDLRFVTKDLVSCRNRNWNVIDHVVVSLQTATRWIAGSERTENHFEYLGPEAAELVSDHCPVVVRFSTLGEDTDGVN